MYSGIKNAELIRRLLQQEIPDKLNRHYYSGHAIFQPKPWWSAPESQSHLTLSRFRDWLEKRFLFPKKKIIISVQSVILFVNSIQHYLCGIAQIFILPQKIKIDHKGTDSQDNINKAITNSSVTSFKCEVSSYFITT